ncbi:MAG: hypothetical protein EKK64_07195 [Neisseriaceae bacterium]|nr:MAG: hypothetical protein EKK64_07195 [Neisseriaceae bacterium]
MKQGWEIKKLDEIIESNIIGLTRNTKEQSILFKYKYVKMNNITKNNSFDFSNYTCVNADIDEINKFSLINGDFLFNTRNSYELVGKTCIFENKSQEKILFNNNIMRIRFKKDISSKFINYLFTSVELIEEINKLKSGTTNVFAIYFKDLKNLNINIPPLPEQERIVSILDKAFSAIDQAKQNAEKNLKNAKELFDSYLNGIFTNKGDDWISSTIGETCKLMTGGTPSTSKKEYYESGNIKWLVSGDINQKEIFDCEGRITELGLENSNARYLPVNSVLIALNGQGKTRGTVAMLRTKATCNQSLVSIYPNDANKILPELIFANLDGRYDDIRKLTGDSGNDRRGLNMPIIRNINFSYPQSLEEQQTIVRQLDAMRTETQRLEEIYQQKIIELDELKKSILQKAFNGEL